MSSNSDEIYKLMREGLRKLSYPLEGVYSGESLKREDSDFNLGEDMEVSHFEDYLKNVSGNILVFHVDMSKPADNLFSLFVQEHGIDFSSSYEKLYRNLSTKIYPISILEKYGKLKRFVESKCKEMSIDTSEVIVLIINSSKESLSVLFRNPLFLLHDFSHGSYSNMKDGDSERKALISLIIDEYGGAYEDSDGKLLKDYNFNYSSYGNIILSEDIPKVTDWENHLFSLSLSKVKGYLRFDDVITVGDPPIQFFKKDEYKDIDFTSAIEEMLHPYMEDRMEHFKGKVVFAIY
jgi:hypothetical protein